MKTMDDKGIKVNRRHLENFVATSACYLCEKDIELINILRNDFYKLFSECRLKEEEFNNLTECLNRMKDIILDYYTDLNKEEDDSNEDERYCKKIED